MAALGVLTMQLRQTRLSRATAEGDSAPKIRTESVTVGVPSCGELGSAGAFDLLRGKFPCRKLLFLPPEPARESLDALRQQTRESITTQPQSEKWQTCRVRGDLSLVSVQSQAEASEIVDQLVMPLMQLCLRVSEQHQIVRIAHVARNRSCSLMM